MTHPRRRKFFRRLRGVSDCDAMVASAQPVRIRLLSSGLPDQLVAETLAELGKHDRDSNFHQYVEALLRVPRAPLALRAAQRPISETLCDTRKHLDSAVRGQEELKDALLQMVSERVFAPDAKPVPLGIQGPPGNGKTTMLRRGLARALDLPFHTVALGGMRDGSHLIGFDKTYANARQGRLADIAIDSGCTNPIIFFDELDKVSDSASGREITDILVHMTDPEGCDTVKDLFVGPIDLSGATLVFAFNDESAVPPVLRNRLRVVRTRGYGVDDKVRIATERLIPSLREEYRIASGVRVDESFVRAMATRCSHETGVRQLRQSLGAAMQRANIAVATNGSVMLGVPEVCLTRDANMEPTCRLAVPGAEGLIDKACGGASCTDAPPPTMYS